MRHEGSEAFERFDEASLAAIWPSIPEVAPPLLPPIEAVQRATPAAPDVPAAVGKMLVAAYAAIIGAFLLTMAGSKEATFMIVISGLYIVVYCSVPWLMMRTEGQGDGRPTLQEFMTQGMVTWTGPTSGRDALVQMLLVPVMLCLCVLAMGVAAALAL